MKPPNAILILTFQHCFFIACCAATFQITIDIDISYNRIIIDAKSLLGILSMDLTRELTVRCYGESQRFNEVMAKFAVA